MPAGSPRYGVPRSGTTCAGCGARARQSVGAASAASGPSDGADTDALAQRLLESGMAPIHVSRLFATFYAGNPVFGQQSRVLSGDTETVGAEEGAEGR